MKVWKKKIHLEAEKLELRKEAYNLEKEEKREQKKKSSKNAEELLGKLMIQPLSDALHFVPWAISLQQLKVETELINKEKKNLD